MKAEIIEKPINKSEFPKLMKSGHIIVLVTGYGSNKSCLSGTVIFGNYDYPFGYFSNILATELFSDFDGKVVLENHSNQSAFPKLMSDDGLIILATGYSINQDYINGTVVSSDSDYPFGYLYDSWITSDFCYYEGKLILEN